MRHRLGLKNLSRPTDQRLAIIYGGVQSLIKYGKIKTTVTRAKEIRRAAERLITLSKRADVHAKRMAYRVLKDRDLVRTLFDMAPRFLNRAGGYTRLTKVGVRRGDAVAEALIEFVD